MKEQRGRKRDYEEQDQGNVSGGKMGTAGLPAGASSSITDQQEEEADKKTRKRTTTTTTGETETEETTTEDTRSSEEEKRDEVSGRAGAEMIAATARENGQRQETRRAAKIQGRRLRQILNGLDKIGQN